MDPRVRTWEAGKADMEAVKRVVMGSRKAQQRKIPLNALAFSTLGRLREEAVLQLVMVNAGYSSSLYAECSGDT